jgi:hypothetical protein
MRPIDQEIDGSSSPADDEWCKSGAREEANMGSGMEKRQLDMIGMVITSKITVHLNV